MQGPGTSGVGHNPSRVANNEPEADATNAELDAQGRQPQELRAEGPSKASASAAVANGFHHPNVRPTTNRNPPAAAAGSASAHEAPAAGHQAAGTGTDVDKPGTEAAAEAQQTSQGSLGQQRKHCDDGRIPRNTAPAANGSTLPFAGRSEQRGAGTKRKAADAAAADGEAGVAPKARKPRLGGTVLIGARSLTAV